MRRYSKLFYALALSSTLNVAAGDSVAGNAVAGNSAAAGESTPTFSRDVAKIVYEKCSICHRPDSSGPFPLLTYDDVQQRAATIDAVLEAKYMPPWKPVDRGLAFANARSLSDEQLQTIRQWIEADCPEGDASETPTAPEFADGWTLGKPDMVLKMEGEFPVPADGPDIYRSFVFPLDLPEDKWVKAVEVQPRAKSAVHHAIFYLDPTGSARELNGADGEVGIAGMGFLGSFGSDAEVGAGKPEAEPAEAGGSFLDRLRGAKPKTLSEEDRAYSMGKSLARGLGGYVPGSTPNLLPGDLAMALPRGSDIVMQTHFHPSGKAETEQPEIALYFADRTPSQQLVPIMVPAMFSFGENLRVPAGEKNYRVSDTFKLPIATKAIGVSAHAHYICREVKLTAELPNGDSLVLLHIDDWDLDWQDQYQYAKPVELPAGTVLHSELVYDNSAENPENPHHPPQEIRWGRGSNDEMGSITLLTVAGEERERPLLQAAARQYFVASLVDRKGEELANMLMQLDDNNDGKLDRSESPPRFDAKMFQFIDANQDGGIDHAEIQRAMDVRDQFRGNGNEAELAQTLLSLYDRNDDQKLQESESVPQISRVFRLVDSDGDGGLDAEELQRMLKFRGRFGTGGD